MLPSSVQKFVSDNSEWVGVVAKTRSFGKLGMKNIKNKMDGKPILDDKYMGDNIDKGIFDYDAGNTQIKIPFLTKIPFSKKLGIPEITPNKIFDKMTSKYPGSLEPTYAILSSAVCIEVLAKIPKIPINDSFVPSQEHINEIQISLSENGIEYDSETISESIKNIIGVIENE